MGLDFTTITDHEGAAIYLVHDGGSANQRKMEMIAESLARHTNKQVVLFSSRDEDGRKILGFYQLSGANFVLIVRDDDQLAHSWGATEIPSADQIAYLANQTG